MRQLLPTCADEVDPYEAYRPGTPDVVRINMVASADGAVVDAGGRSGSLGGPGDMEVFRSLRAHADAIVVGAGTVRAESYGPHRLRRSLADRRRADGRDAPAAIVVVSRSLELDWTAPLFTEAVTPTIVVTCAAAPAAARRAAAAAAEVLEAGEAAVDPGLAAAALRSLGHRSLLVEGGPGLNAPWLAAGVVDELCLTIAPALLGEVGPRLAGALPARIGLGLRAVLAEGEELFLRYAVQNSRSSSDSTPLSSS